MVEIKEFVIIHNDGEKNKFDKGMLLNLGYNSKVLIFNYKGKEILLVKRMLKESIKVMKKNINEIMDDGDICTESSQNKNIIKNIEYTSILGNVKEMHKGVFMTADPGDYELKNMILVSLNLNKKEVLEVCNVLTNIHQNLSRKIRKIRFKTIISIFKNLFKN